MEGWKGGKLSFAPIGLAATEATVSGVTATGASDATCFGGVTAGALAITTVRFVT